MVRRAKQTLAALLDRPIEVGEELIRLPNGVEYVRIVREGSYRSPTAPTTDRYGGDTERGMRTEAAMSLHDDDTFGFLLIRLRRGHQVPAKLTAQIPPEWRGYTGAILGRVLRAYAVDRDARPRSGATR